jgi:prepilin-type N-terminal cleavage/methylation domain-containing protein
MKGKSAGSRVLRRGVTLIELAVVMAIVLVLAGSATPAILRSVERGRIETAALQFAQDLRLVRESAILYQSDLYAYVPAPSSSVTWYCYEQLPRLGSGGLPDGTHNVPPLEGASWPDPERIVRRDLPFNTRIVSVTSSVPAQVHNGSAYYEIRFRSGEDPSNPGSTLYVPGSVVAPITIVIGDSAGRTWQVAVDAVGRAHLIRPSS